MIYVAVFAISLLTIVNGVMTIINVKIGLDCQEIKGFVKTIWRIYAQQIEERVGEETPENGSGQYASEGPTIIRGGYGDSSSND